MVRVKVQKILTFRFLTFVIIPRLHTDDRIKLSLERKLTSFSIMKFSEQTNRLWSRISCALLLQSVCIGVQAGLEEVPLSIETTPIYVQAAEYSKANKKEFGLGSQPASEKDVRHVDNLIKELKSLGDRNAVVFTPNELSYLDALIGDLYQTLRFHNQKRLTYYKQAGDQLVRDNPLGSMAHAHGLELLAEYNSFQGSRQERQAIYKERLDERNIAALVKLDGESEQKNYCRTKMSVTFDYYYFKSASQPPNEQDAKFYKSNLQFLDDFQREFHSCLNTDEIIAVYRAYQSNYLFLDDYKNYSEFRKKEFELYSTQNPKLDRPYIEAATSILGMLVSELISESDNINKLQAVSHVIDQQGGLDTQEYFEDKAFAKKLSQARLLNTQIGKAITENPEFYDFQEMYADSIAPISDKAQVEFANKLIRKSAGAGELSDYNLQKAYGILSTVYENRKMLDEAILYRQVSLSLAISNYIDTYKSISKQSSSGNGAPPTVLYEYEIKDLQRLYQKQGRVAESIQLSELLKAGEYIEFTRAGPHGLQTIATMLPFSSDEKASVKSVRELNKNRASPEAIDATVKEIVVRKSNVGKGVQTKVSETEAPHARLVRSLGFDVAFLNYTVHKNGVSIDVVTHNNLDTTFIAIEQSELESLIIGFTQKLRDRSSNPISHAKKLYEVLMAPVEGTLIKAGAKVLMVSLDDKLRYVPFSALFDGNRYAIEKWALPVYTAQVRQKPRRSNNPDSFVGFGVSKAWGSLPALPEVKSELNHIADSNTGVLKGDIYLDESFTAQRLKASMLKNYKIVHVASHFVFSPGTEENSYLLLGDGKQLSLSSIRKSNFRFDHTDLLTLSACDTAKGGGRDANGKEIEGFSVLAQKQGAKAVLATLWKVNDKSTAVLMADMYAMKVKGKTKIEALRQAQLDLKQKPEYAHPYYWAPFILMGNWQ